MSSATVSRVLTRQGLNRLQALVPPEPVRRYAREHPGELIHIDIKKLGRFDQPGHRVTGSRSGESAVAVLEATITTYARLGVTVARVMTDHGSCYRSRRLDGTAVAADDHCAN